MNIQCCWWWPGRERNDTVAYIHTQSFLFLTLYFTLTLSPSSRNFHLVTTDVIEDFHQSHHLIKKTMATFQPADLTQLKAAVSELAANGFTDYSGSALANNVHISLWDTSLITDMSELFNGAGSFNGDISGWNTAKVTNMLYMFRGASSFGYLESLDAPRSCYSYADCWSENYCASAAARRLRDGRRLFGGLIEEGCTDCSYCMDSLSGNYQTFTHGLSLS